MAAISFVQFHELAERSRGKIPLKRMCEQQGVSYRRYSYWRKRMGIALRRNNFKTPVPEGMIEVTAEEAPASLSASPRATGVRIVFENGLTFERQRMDVDALIAFLSKIRDVLCLG